MTDRRHGAHRMRAHREAGFTLVEMLMALAIVGILGAIAVPELLKARDKAFQAKCDEPVHNLDAELAHVGENMVTKYGKGGVLPSTWPNTRTYDEVLRRHRENTPRISKDYPRCEQTNPVLANPNCAYVLRPPGFIPWWPDFGAGRCQSLLSNYDPRRGVSSRTWDTIWVEYVDEKKKSQVYKIQLRS